MKKIFTLFLVCISIFTSINTVYAKNNNSNSSSANWPKKAKNIYSNSAILMDASSGLILYEKNIHEKHYPASITKIMTTLLAIENSSLNEIVTYSRNAIFGIERDSSHIGLDVGEELTMEQSLYAIMLESANEAAYGVAEHVSGNLTSFVKLMNAKAKELGCKNTHFVNANGLHDDNHYTTAYDMALIAKAAINNPIFRKITSTVTYTIPPTNIQEETRYLNNHHKMLKNSIYHYDDCIGGKTGYTTKSNHTLVTFAKRGDLELICVIMNSDLTHQYTDTAALFDYGFKNYSAYKISSLNSQTTTDDSPFFTKFNCLFCKETSPIKVSSDGYVILPNTANVNDISRNVVINSNSPTVENSGSIGSIKYIYDNKVVGSSNIEYVKSSSPSLNTPAIREAKADTNIIGSIISFHDKNRIKPIVIVIAVVVFFYLLYFIIIERPRLKRRRAYYHKRKKRTSNFDRDFIDYN